LETRFRRLSIDFDVVTLQINQATVDQAFCLNFIDFERKRIAQYFSKSSLYFQLFFGLNQGTAGFKINTSVTIKSFPLKI